MGTVRSVGRLALLAVLLGACSAKDDLQQVCDAFANLELEPNLAVMVDSDRMRFVNDRVSPKLSRFSKVTPLWKLIPNFESEARYRMFKRGADELVGNWDCPAMERLAPSLSQPVVGSR